MAKWAGAKVKYCPQCSTESPRFSNLGYCIACKSIYDQNRKQKIKQEYKEFLHARGCVACGEKHPDCLEVHHLYKDAKRFKNSRGNQIYIIYLI